MPAGEGVDKKRARYGRRHACFLVAIGRIQHDDRTGVERHKVTAGPGNSGGAGDRQTP